MRSRPALVLALAATLLPAAIAVADPDARFAEAEARFELVRAVAVEAGAVDDVVLEEADELAEVASELYAEGGVETALELLAEAIALLPPLPE